MNGYHEGVACEHRYDLKNGGTCGDAAFVILYGLPLCEPHFEDRVNAAMVENPLGRDSAGQVRRDARPVPPPPQPDSGFATGIALGIIVTVVLMHLAYLYGG